MEGINTTITSIRINIEKRRMAKSLGINISEALDNYLTALFSDKLNNEDVDMFVLTDQIKDLKQKIAELNNELTAKLSIVEQIKLKMDQKQKEKTEQTKLKVNAIKKSGFAEDLV